MAAFHKVATERDPPVGAARRDAGAPVQATVTLNDESEERQRFSRRDDGERRE